MEVEENQELTSYFSALPEDLISLILSKTSIRDACQLSAVSTQFRSAAESDVVWECLLPSHYRDIISMCDDPLFFTSKKDLCSRLSRSIIFLHNNTLAYGYNSSGKACCGLLSKSLRVTSEHPRPHSWFVLNQETSYELVVNFGHRFHIIGTLDSRTLLSPNTTYVAYLCYKTTEIDGFNFNDFSSTSPSTVVSMRFLKNGHELITQFVFCINLVIHHNRMSSSTMENGFLELKMGEFLNNTRFDTVKVNLIETEGLPFYNGPAIIFLGIRFCPIS